MYRLGFGSSSKRDKAKNQDEALIREKPPKKTKKKKKKKKQSADGKGESKKKKIKKMRMRLMGKKSKKPKRDPDFVGQDDTPDDDDAIRLPPTTIDQQYGAYGSSSPAAGIGGSSSGLPASGSVDTFQLDNVSPGGMRRSEDVRRLGGPADEANKKFRVKPFHSFPAPLYLNETELYQNMMVASDEFEFLSSYLDPSTKATRRAKVPEVVRKHFGSPKEDGRVGSLRVEVLGCVGLDRAKPDVSVYLVVGDCAFTTDIITGARSPMWPYSSKRAAVFPLHHAYARLFVGVFDVKQRKNSEADHYCGRVAIDIPPLRPDTEYDITFPLRASTFIYDRRPRGVVRLRFSLHWFSERAAIMSYLKRPRNPLAFSKQAKKQPTIPCGDPKTFRNVAVTVHGQDFPGKYTRAAFRATMREFNLCQQNVRFLFKVTILDCVLYENPFMSLYLFCASMYCIWFNTVRYVPPFFIGWIIYLFVETYISNTGTTAGHLGYRPLTMSEIFYGFMRDGRDKRFNFKPILVKKRARNQVLTEEGKTQDIELMNHREFPFSERFEYHKLSAAEAIAPSPASKKQKGATKGSDLRTARRLSIYVAPVEEEEEDDSESDDSAGDENSDQGENDEEGMMDQGDDGFGNMQDSDDEDDDDEDEEGKGRLFQAGRASTTRRIRVGPPQNSDRSGRKVPPQVHLSRVEHMLHRATKNISVEHVHFPPPHLQMNLGKEYNAKGPASDVITAKEKQLFDEFDRILGFRTKNPNPILRITSSFLGPLMRIIRIVIYATRIGFNVTAWRDPFLTFWVFSFLCTAAFILLIFPWRTFFLLSTLVLLGPQNIAVRLYLERRAKEKEQDEKDAKERDKLLSATQQQTLPAQSAAKTPVEDKSVSTKKSKSRFPWSRRKDKSDTKQEGEGEINEADLYQSPRPAFYAHTRPTRTKQLPRDVAVPYFRFRKERFYDWPPDPTVSRATPLLATSRSAESEFELDGNSTHVQNHRHHHHHHHQHQANNSYHQRLPSQQDSDEYLSMDQQQQPRGVRRRRGRPQQPPSQVDYGYG